MNRKNLAASLRPGKAISGQLLLRVGQQRLRRDPGLFRGMRSQAVGDYNTRKHESEQRQQNPAQSLSPPDKVSGPVWGGTLALGVRGNVRSLLDHLRSD